LIGALDFDFAPNVYTAIITKESTHEVLKAFAVALTCGFVRRWGVPLASYTIKSDHQTRVRSYSAKRI
jgi:hypothetical protein